MFGQPWGPAVLRHAKWLFEVYTVSCSIACLFTVLFLEQTVHGVCEVMFKEVGQRLEDDWVSPNLRALNNFEK